MWKCIFGIASKNSYILFLMWLWFNKVHQSKIKWLIKAPVQAGKIGKQKIFQYKTCLSVCYSSKWTVTTLLHLFSNTVFINVDHLSVTEFAPNTQTGVGAYFCNAFSDYDQHCSENRWVSTLPVWNVLYLMHFGLIPEVAACSCLLVL